MYMSSDVQSFGALLRSKRAEKPLFSLGELSLSARRESIGPVRNNKKDWEILQGLHDYVLEIGGVTVKLSAQFYKNVRGHYRLFAYSRVGNETGMLFSLNLTILKDIKGVLGLSQRIRFSEGRGQGLAPATAIRDAKTRMFADILTRSGITVTDNLEVHLGTYSAESKQFLDTTAPKFISQFLTVALLKGHFQGNKGYQFACLPRFDDSFSWKWDSSESVRTSLAPNKRGAAGSRAIPLGLRYQVLERDRSRCCACGAGPGDGASLHIDHIRPYSLGGLTILANLQTLCSQCNLGKGNRSSMDHRQNSG